VATLPLYPVMTMTKVLRCIPLTRVVSRKQGVRGRQPPKELFCRRAARAGVALERAMLFATWLVPVVERFPRRQRFLLDDRLQTR